MNAHVVHRSWATWFDIKARAPKRNESMWCGKPVSQLTDEERAEMYAYLGGRVVFGTPSQAAAK